MSAIHEDHEEHSSYTPEARPPQNIESPIFRLPTEITLTIFKLVIDITPGLKGRQSVPDPRRTPVALSSICWLFRQQILGAPSLWCTIQFRLRVNGIFKMPLDQLEVYLERSQESTIDVLFDIMYYYQRTEHEQIQSQNAWNLVRPHLPRCGLLSVHGPASLGWLFPIPGRLSRLQCLDVSMRQRKGSRGGIEPIITKEAHCQLLTLSLGHFRRSNFALAGIDATSIRTLTLHIPEEDAPFLALLNHCPVLQSLSLSVLVDPSSDIEIPSLKSLAMNGSNCVNWLTRLSAPNLEHLDFATWIDGVPVENSRTQTLLSLPPKFPYLRTFFLDSFPENFPAARIVDLLHSLQYIVAVCLPCGMRLTNVLSGMLVKMDQYPLDSFSKLRVVSSAQIDAENIDVVIQLLERLPCLRVECFDVVKVPLVSPPERFVVLDSDVPHHTLEERFGG